VFFDTLDVLLRNCVGTNRDTGTVHRVGSAGLQWMPGGKIPSFGSEAVGAGARQPLRVVQDVADLETFGYALAAVRVVGTAAPIDV
jgi:hypothetical protein